MQDDRDPLEQQLGLLSGDSTGERLHDPACILCSLPPGKEQQQKFESLSRQLRKIRPRIKEDRD